MALFNQFRRVGGSDAASTGSQVRTSTMFPSPWLDPASTELPENMEEIYRFCELLWYSSGTYAKAMERVAGYFVTRVNVDNVDKGEAQRWEEFLNDQFHINRFLVDVGRNLLCYGTVGISPQVAVHRMLSCPRCGQMAPISQWQYRFKPTRDEGEFHTEGGGCPKCKRGGILKRQDFRPLSADSMSMKMWNPHLLKTKHNSITDRTIVWYSLSQSEAQQIRRGDKDMLEDTPWEFIQAAVKQKPLRFNPDMIYLLRDKPLAGIETQGLGLPRSMAAFRQAYLQQVLNRVNMVLGMEYSIPFRSITPAPQGQGQMGDPTMGMDMGDITPRLLGLLGEWKRDPAAIHSFPVPLQYQSWGGEGMNMVSHQVAEQTMNQLLTSLGVPVDFFVGTVRSERTFAPTLRLLERTWQDLVSSYNEILDWLGKTMASLLRWKEPKLTLESTTMADDMDLRNVLLDLYMQGRVSGTTALSPLGVDPVEENTKMVEEQVEMQQEADEATARLDRDTTNLAQTSSLYGQMGGGQPADPSAPSAMQNTPQRPDEIMEQARQMAEQLLQKSYEERQPHLRELRQNNDLLHRAVRQEMDRIRGQRGSDTAQAQQ